MADRKKNRIIAKFIEEIAGHPMNIIKDEVDRKSVAMYMHEKKFHSFKEYIEHCAEYGKSLMTLPNERTICQLCC